jgi:hypothetical protein
MKNHDREVIIDPFVLSWTWNGFAPAELAQERKLNGDEPPTDIEEDDYIYRTSEAIFGGDNVLDSNSFINNTLLYTTRIRTLFSGKKFEYFRDELFDSVSNKYHRYLKDVRPLFDDPSYSSYRKGRKFDDLRPWDWAMMGVSPSEHGIGKQNVRFDTSTVGIEGTVVRKIIRFLNEDLDSESLIEDVLAVTVGNDESIYTIDNFHQTITDYLALNQYSFGLPYFSFKDVSEWQWFTFRGSRLRKAVREEVSLPSKISHAVNITLPDLKDVSLEEILDVRRHRFFSSYRKMIDAGGFQNMTREDVDQMLWDVMYKETRGSAPGVKEFFFDIAKAVVSWIPLVGNIVDSGESAISIISRVRQYNNGWLWFVMDAKNEYGNNSRNFSPAKLPQR